MPLRLSALSSKLQIFTQESSLLSRAMFVPILRITAANSLGCVTENICFCFCFFDSPPFAETGFEVRRCEPVVFAALGID